MQPEPSGIKVEIEVSEAWLEEAVRMLGLTLTKEELVIVNEFNREMLVKSVTITARKQLLHTLTGFEQLKHYHGEIKSVEMLEALETEARAKEAYHEATQNTELKLGKLKFPTEKKGYDA